MMIHTKSFILTLALIILLFGCTSEGATQTIDNVNSIVYLGVMADCQYANQPDRGKRLYRLSALKLDSAVNEFNASDLDHVIHLGDFIDTGLENYDIVLQKQQNLKIPMTHVLGNHDFSVPDSLKYNVPSYLGLMKRYFSFYIKSWKFIVLDGNDVSLHAWSKNSPKYIESKNIYEKLYSDQPKYNGALGKSQLVWLKRELEKSELKNENVIILCHFPVLPEGSHHQLWNWKEIIALLSNYKCVKAWLNGHNHAGGYDKRNGIHYVTFKGMVDSRENSFAKLTISDEVIKIIGFGREKSRELILKK